MGGAGTENGSLLLTVLATRAKPNISGEEDDWKAFSQDWDAYWDIHMEAEGGHCTYFLFEALKGCVDTAYDSVGARRKEWERMPLKAENSPWSRDATARAHLS